MSHNLPLQILKATKEALERALHPAQQHGAVTDIEEVRHGISTTQMLIELLESTERCMPEKVAKEVAYNHSEAVDPKLLIRVDCRDAYAMGMVSGIQYAYNHLIVHARAQRVIAAGGELRSAMTASSDQQAHAMAEWDRLQVKPTEHVVTVDQAMEVVERLGVKETYEAGYHRHETGMPRSNSLGR